MRETGVNRGFSRYRSEEKECRVLHAALFIAQQRADTIRQDECRENFWRGTRERSRIDLEIS
jgi:hypothetical protein